MRYYSLFSGVGGLEHPTISPVACCEIDPTCHPVLSRRMNRSNIFKDVKDLRPDKADAVVGGFPCQDLSIAGKMAGLNGRHSSLFFEMLRISKEACADHVIAENVPNLIRLKSGEIMRTVILELHKEWRYVAWRTLNAREFSLPQQRKRVIILASKSKAVALNLFRTVRTRKHSVIKNPSAAGFYTTAGSRSICYSKGFVPTVKVGSSLSIPGPPGIHFGDVVRKATLNECLALQGFSRKPFHGVKSKDVFRQMGNAVPVPMGEFALRTLTVNPVSCEMASCQTIGANGFYDGSLWSPRRIHLPELANNLECFLESSDETLSERAASGLVRRLTRSGTSCPDELLLLLRKIGNAPD